jgi:hypothetical protein
MNLLDTVFLSHEAWFNLNQYADSQNSRIWSSEHPHFFHKVPLHLEKLGVWCALSWCVVAPIFFEETIYGNLYWDIVTTQFISLLKVDECDCWFQQDSATCHSATLTLQEFFGNCLISKDLWSPRSLYLSFNFFLWGYLKGVTYRTNPHTLEELETNIKVEIVNITVATLRKVSANMFKRLCLYS